MVSSGCMKLIRALCLTQCFLILLQCESGDAVLGVLSKPGLTTRIERSRRSLSDPLYFHPQTFGQIFVNDRIIERTAASPFNDITIDLSNPDYIPNHHLGIRRVKKVLPSDGADNLDLEAFLKVRDTPPRQFQYLPRSKRFVGFFDPMITDILPYLSLSPSPALDKNHASQLPLATSEIKKIPAKNSVKKQIKNKNPRTKTSITGLEFKLFQNTLLEAITSICPKLHEDYSILLGTIEESVHNEIRAAHNLLPKPKASSSNKRLFSLMRKISKCSQGFSHKRQLQHDLVHTKIDALNQEKVKEGPLGPVSLRDYFIKEGKRIARMAQKDVIPSTNNLLQFYSIIFKKIEQNCLQDKLDLQSENHRTGSLLLSIIGLKKKTHYGKLPTLHKHEMEKLIEATQSCGNVKSVSKV